MKQVSIPIDPTTIPTALEDSDLPTSDVIGVLIDSALAALDLDGLYKLHDELKGVIEDIEYEDAHFSLKLDKYDSAPIFKEPK